MSYQIIFITGIIFGFAYSVLLDRIIVEIKQKDYTTRAIRTETIEESSEEENSEEESSEDDDPEKLNYNTEESYLESWLNVLHN